MSERYEQEIQDDSQPAMHLPFGWGVVVPSIHTGSVRVKGEQADDCGFLSVYVLRDRKAIGDEVAEDDIIKPACVMLSFRTVADIEAMQERLERMKGLMGEQDQAS